VFPPSTGRMAVIRDEKDAFSRKSSDLSQEHDMADMPPGPAVSEDVGRDVASVHVKGGAVLPDTPAGEEGANAPGLCSARDSTARPKANKADHIKVLVRIRPPLPQQGESVMSPSLSFDTGNASGEKGDGKERHTVRVTRGQTCFQGVRSSTCTCLALRFEPRTKNLGSKAGWGWAR
jgi:hypothetical protein